MNLLREISGLPTAIKLAVWLAIALSSSSCLPEATWQQAAPMYPQPRPPVAYQPPPSPGIQFLAEVEGEVLRLANEARRQQALPPLAGEQALAGAARRHSGDMLARGFFSHTNPDGWSASQRLPRGYAQVLRQSGENIWMGSGQNPYAPRHLAGTIMATLMASPGHRQNLLDPQYTHLGVGVAARGQEVRATQVFGQLPGGLANR
jgi:uncharacterized protein YkwD